MAGVGPATFRLSDPPSVLFDSLAYQGYCVVDAATDTTEDAADVLCEWFAQPSSAKQAAAVEEGDAAAAAGRGYFSLPDKEVLEVKQQWRPAGVQGGVRLAAKSAFCELQSVASNLLQLLFSDSIGDKRLKATLQQLQAWVGHSASGPAASTTSTAQSSNSSSINSSSVLHVSSYRSASASPAALLGGAEAHVDRGLLTVIADTAPGLQVLGRDGSWVPVTLSRHQLVVLVGHTLSFATAGRLPAALHRVKLPAGSSSSSAPRLSLAFKLQAVPEAVFEPAAIAGAVGVPDTEDRYCAPKRTHELMAAFDAEHLSIHHSSEEQQQQSKRPCNNSAAAQRSSGTGTVLNITIMNQAGSKVAVQVRDNTRFDKLMAHYLQHQRKRHPDLPSLYLLFDGQRLLSHLTPKDVGMEDGDVVDALLEQLGD